MTSRTILLGGIFWKAPRRLSLPLCLGVAKVEQEFADQVLACVQLDADWCQTVLKALANQGPSQITAWMSKG